MGRAKLNMQLIRDPRVRNSTYVKRNKGLKKKVHELSTLCGVDACMISYGPMLNDRPISPDTWPETPANRDKVLQIIDHYHQHCKDGLWKRNFSIGDFYKVQKKKVDDEIAKMQNKNKEVEYLVWAHHINGLSVDQLNQFLGTLDSKLKRINYRIESMKENQSYTEEELQMIPLNQIPYSIPNTYHGSGWNNNDLVMNTETGPIAYEKPLSYHMMPMNYPTNLPVICNQETMMSLNGYNGDRINMVPMDNLLYPESKKPPCLDNGVLYSNEKTNFMNERTSASTNNMQPMPLSNFYYMMPGSSDQKSLKAGHADEESFSTAKIIMNPTTSINGYNVDNINMIPMENQFFTEFKNPYENLSYMNERTYMSTNMQPCMPASHLPNYRMSESSDHKTSAKSHNSGNTDHQSASMAKLTNNPMTSINRYTAGNINMTPLESTSYVESKKSYAQDEAALGSSKEFGLINQNRSTLSPLCLNMQPMSTSNHPYMMLGSSDQIPSVKPPYYGYAEDVSMYYKMMGSTGQMDSSKSPTLDYVDPESRYN
ncbi:Mads box protein [Thalictrum thalictroides]|uniref:Mads box protein n=1 Tax=Thalictrum thalictroides TaxID=46969 RepID=A0A7J6WGP0_THATH|nr:Mads box protein [Thalictrum thalictroides]